jgi:hypothetical protein
MGHDRRLLSEHGDCESAKRFMKLLEPLLRDRAVDGRPARDKPASALPSLEVIGGSRRSFGFVGSSHGLPSRNVSLVVPRLRWL